LCHLQFGHGIIISRNRAVVHDVTATARECGDSEANRKDDVRYEIKIDTFDVRRGTAAEFAILPLAEALDPCVCRQHTAMTVSRMHLFDGKRRAEIRGQQIITHSFE